MNVTKNFSNQEIGCKCGCGMLPTRASQEKLQAMRDAYGKPLRINSGARCLKHNTAIGSTPTSSHVTGMAYDISIAGLSDSEVLYIAFLGGKAGFHRIAINRRANFIHLDDDTSKPTKFWSY
jgi:uncharacterized protein YcbK (DUF882 family)